MDWVRTINDAIEYMEENLTEDITLADISKAVNLSAFHFQRAFTLLTGMSPAEYLRKRRLSQAGSELAKGDWKVIDIALRYGYDSPESFTKAFTRFHGVSPAQVKKGEPIRFMSRYTVRITIEGGCIMEYKIENMTHAAIRTVILNVMRSGFISDTLCRKELYENTRRGIKIRSVFY